MKVDLICPYLSKLSGGIIEVVEAMHTTFSKKEGITVEVKGLQDTFASANDSLSKKSLYKEFKVIGPRIFGYSNSLSRSLKNTKSNLLHTHGLWMFYSYAALKAHRTRNLPIVISPHGMLDDWALNNSGWKKFFVTLLFERAHLNSASAIHALNESEYKSIRKFGVKAPIAIIPNGVNIPDKSMIKGIPNWKKKINDDKKIMLFLGRLHPKKGLDSLIKAWSMVPKNQWNLVVAGWAENGYENELKKMVKNLDLENQVHFIGSVFEDEKTLSYLHSDAFILPSYSEGLPMTILEAWANKKAVLMTKECNLSNSFIQNAAIEISNDPNQLSSQLHDFFKRPYSEIKEIASNGFQLVTENYSWEKVCDQFFELYVWVLFGGDIPKFVRNY